MARLTASTDDAGHPQITLELRSPPGGPEADRQSQTFVFAPADSYVVRSTHDERPHHKQISDSRYEYNHPGGRPVLRSALTTFAGQARTQRLDVEECRFGPIPESEFAPGPFLDRLRPDGIVPAAGEGGPITAMVDWHRLPFAVGGASLIGGCGLALRGRSRDRTHRQADEG